MNKFTVSDYEAWKNLYLQGQSTYSIAEAYLANPKTIQLRLSAMGVTLRISADYSKKPIAERIRVKKEKEHTPRTYTTKYFPNPFLPLSDNSAWTLGVWYTDGHVTNKLAVVTQKDREILDKIKAVIAPNEYDDRVKIFPYSGKSTAWVLRLSSVDMVRYLSDCGVHKQKSRTMEFPNWIPENSMPHFVRGLWDGDGYIGLDKRNTIQTTYCCGSKLFIESLASLVGSIVGIAPNLYKQKTTECYTFSVNGKKAIVFLNWLYGNSTSENRLNRKYSIYINSSPVHHGQA